MSAEYTSGLEINEDMITQLLRWGFTGRRTPLGYTLELHAICVRRGVSEIKSVLFQAHREAPGSEWYHVLGDRDDMCGLLDFLHTEAVRGDVRRVERVTQ